jgi:hypothetical protein
MSKAGIIAIWDSRLARSVRLGGGSSALGDAVARPRDDRQKDLLRPALDEIIDLGHRLVRLAREIDWGFLDQRFASVCTPGPGQPGLPARLVAGLFILKHMHNLSDEVLWARWLENPYYQFFCGELSFCHRLPFDRSSLTHWRQRLGEEQLVALIQESLSIAHRPERWRRAISSASWSTPRYSQKPSRIQPMRGCVIAPWKNWSNWRGATRCRYGRVTGASPNAPQSGSGATPMRTSSSGPGVS